MKHKNNHLKTFKEEYESKFDDYRKTDKEEYENYINRKLGELPIDQFLKQLTLHGLLWDFDAVSLYPSAMSDENSIYPKTETGYACSPNMKDELVEKFKNQTFSQGSAILKIKYYNPKNLIVQHLPVKRKVKNSEIYRQRTGYIVDVLTSADIQEIV